MSPSSGITVTDISMPQAYQVAYTLTPEVASACDCATSNIVRGVRTGIPGCARHGGELVADRLGLAYCFIEGGDATCPEAEPSMQFQGMYWAPCSAPDFKELYPAGCEL